MSDPIEVDVNILCECCNHPLRLHDRLVSDPQEEARQEFHNKLNKEMLEELGYQHGEVFYGSGGPQNPYIAKLQQWCCHKIIEGSPFRSLCPCNKFIPVEEEEK